MQKLIFILGATIGSIIAGYVVRRVVAGRSDASDRRLLGMSRAMKQSAFFFLQPITFVSTFWNMNLSDVPFLLFPILGLISVFLAGAVSLIVIRVLKIPAAQAASVFTAGMFTNVLTFGGLIGFVFFGEIGYLYAQLFTMFIAVSYYLVGYPVSHNIAKEIRPVFHLDPRFFRENPFIVLPTAAMALGLILNVAGIERVAFMETVVAINVPLVAILLGLAIGLSLRFSSIAGYRREIGIVMLIKFVLMPLLLIPLGWALGLPAAGEGVPFKMLVTLSVMPVAFNALVPPAIFGFDLDLANSAWLVTTASLVVIVPVLYVILM
jgi:predicted permease